MGQHGGNRRGRSPPPARSADGSSTGSPEQKRPKDDTMQGALPNTQLSSQDLAAAAAAAEQKIQQNGTASGSAHPTMHQPAPWPTPPTELQASAVGRPGVAPDPLQSTDPWAGARGSAGSKRGALNSPEPSRVGGNGTTTQFFIGDDLNDRNGTRAPASAAQDLPPAEEFQISGDPNQPPVRSELAQILSNFNSRTKRAVDAAQSKLQQELHAEVHHLLAELDASNQRQFQEHASQISELRLATKDLRKEFETLVTELTAVRASICSITAPRAIETEARDESFDAPPNPTIIRLNCHEMVDRGAVAASIQGWLSEAELALADQVDLRGPVGGLSKKWTLIFHGAPALAQRRVRKALLLLKSSDGQWRNFEVTTPTTRVLPLYIGPDKNPKRIATEVLAKKAHKEIERQLPGKKLHLLKADGIITINGRSLCKVTPYADGSFDLHWVARQLGSLQVSKADVIAACEVSRRASAEEVEWSL